MRLIISSSEWNVLAKILYNSGVNPFLVNDIIAQHKKILNDFKDKLEFAKAVELEKFKRELEEKNYKNKEDKILKFETKQEEELTDKFKKKWYEAVQKIEGKF